MVDVPSSNLTLSGSAPTLSVAYNRIEVPSGDLKLVPELLEINGLVTRVIQPQSGDLVLTRSVPSTSSTTSAAVEIPSADLVLSSASIAVYKVVPWVSPNDNPNLLCPTDIIVRIVTFTESPPGRSFTGKKQFVQADAGYIKITLDRIRIRSNNDVLEWRKLEGALDGRRNAALIPIPAEDATIVATADADVADGATTIFMDVSTGNDPEEGVYFSAVDRLYLIKEVVSQVGSVFEVLVLPPVREPIVSGTVLEFAEPVCRCRLMRDDGMNIVHELMIHSTPTVEFCEDWVRS